MHGMPGPGPVGSAVFAVSSFRSFPAGRSPEDDPGGEVVGEVDKAVFDAGTHEERIAGRKVNIFTVQEEHTTAGMHDVELVLRVRLLIISADGTIIAELHGAMLKQAAVLAIIRCSHSG